MVEDDYKEQAVYQASAPAQGDEQYRAGMRADGWDPDYAAPSEASRQRRLYAQGRLR